MSDRYDEISLRRLTYRGGRTVEGRLPVVSLFVPPSPRTVHRSDVQDLPPALLDACGIVDEGF